MTIDKGKKLASHPIKEKKSENSPDFTLEMYVPKKQDTAEEIEDLF